MKSKRSTSAGSRSSKFLDRFWANRDMRYTRLGPTPKTTQASAHQPDNKDSDGDIIPLQCLDAQLLLMHGKHIGDRSNASPAGSSLDLEWEHEELRHQYEQHSWLVLPDDSDVTTSSSSGASSSTGSRQLMLVPPHQPVAVSRRNTSRSSSDHWSHRSTPDSLEWDVNEADHQRFQSNEDLLDTDTMELLQEIEWLKNRALSETGDACRTTAAVVETES